MNTDTGRLRVDAAERFDDPERLRLRLVQPGSQGWICFTDRVEAWSGDVGGVGHGHVISAEVALADGRTSLHARLAGGIWEVRELVREDEGEDRVQARSYLAQGPHQGAFRPQALRYEVWWRAETREEGIRAWAPLAARFVGLEGER